MSDFDLINSIASEPIRPPEHVSLEQIINEVPNMDLKTPATYALYLHYNPHLDDGEREKVTAIIEKMRVERTQINKRNIDYMDKHIKEESDEEMLSHPNTHPPPLVRS